MLIEVESSLPETGCWPLGFCIALPLKEKITSFGF